MRMEMRNENRNVKFGLKLDGQSYELTRKDFFNELST